MRSTPSRLAALALFVCAAAAAPAAAGEFTVAQCDLRNPDFADARFDRTDGAYYGLSRGCGKPAESSALKVENRASAPTGAEGRIAWLAPPGLRVVGVTAEARLRADAGHRARLSYLDAAGEQAGRIAGGLDEPGGFRRHTHRLGGIGRAGFAAQLICVSGVSCAHSEQARAWIRGVRLTLRDAAAPTLGLSGSLLEPGWLRGERELVAAAGDLGGGLRRLDVEIGGAPVGARQPLPCALTSSGALARTMSPCPRARSARLSLETGAAPLADGVNRLTVCAQDFGTAANRTCLERRVLVDNRSPKAAFRERNGRDPEVDLGLGQRRLLRARRGHDRVPAAPRRALGRARD